MTKASAEKAVIASALTVFGVYFYRHLTEGTTTANNGAKQMIGSGTPPNFGRFLTGWGFAYFVIALVTEAAPGLGGSFAILVGLTDFLVSAQQIEKDINQQLTQPPASATSSTSATSKSGTKTAKGKTPGTAASAAARSAQLGQGLASTSGTAISANGATTNSGGLDNTPTQQLPQL